ncbi:VTC domain-containing protein [Radiomyces spectabilis]|uniref:VTC domain-containing protein n=1 Tax=Radiomyces spectabilis TaxID=64574 RepID=UPI002221009F|nr:VTC domain-containing protein [Radiomyces spectabilis]KAI8376002.1 VTC domain-containing protein [Radiomyces spectabilis]
MKFGAQLKDAIYPDWKPYYLDYDGLKRKLRKAEKDRPFTEKDETEFVEMLDNNLEKVYAFQQEKMKEIRNRTDEWANKIASDISPEGSVAEMAEIQENINEIADDINRLARFSRLNYTGFLKMVKKHDRHTAYVLRPMFMVRLNQCPFWNENNDAILIKLSELFDQVRRGGRTMSFKASSSVLKEQGIRLDGRRTVVKRFFVQPENVLELKTYVLRHLPVLVYRDNSTKKDNIDPPISSLYLDNADLDAYNSRVESAQGSEVIRLRWYGSAKNNRLIAVERRALAEENRGELKDRFIIKDKYIDGYLHGDQTFIQKSVQKMRNSGRSEEDVSRYEHLVTDIQRTILEKEMQPMLRTYYKRTAFQIPGDKSVRMALDTDLCFIREDSKLFPNDPVVRRSEGQWRRPDVDTNFPFTNLKDDGEINRYPFATFEIKLDLASDEKEPEWVEDLQESGILEEAFDFSKFVHGIAVMFDTRVALLPYWLAQMDSDLKELPVLPSQIPSVGKKLPKGKGRAIPLKGEEEGQDEQEANTVEPVQSPTGDVRVNMGRTSASSTTGSPAAAEPTERTSLLGRQARSSTTSYMGINRSVNEPHASEATWKDKLQAMPKTIGQTFHQWFGHPTAGADKAREPVILPPGVKVPKKVITPLRVEPKVFFANERTYFSWMSLGTLMATFSIALFNAGDAVGKISGVVYTLVSLSTLLYGMGLYYRRRELIRARASGPYDDITGPTAICLALLFAVALNAYLKFTIHSPSLFYL